MKAAATELKWTAEIIRAFSWLEKVVNDQPILVIAYFVIGVFVSLVPGAFLFAFLAQMVMFQAIACDTIRKAWNGLQGAEAAAREPSYRTGLPLLSLVFLHAVYLGVLFVAAFALILPAVWWAIKSSLAIVFVCLEDFGALEALKLSHRLTKERFWLTAGYLVPVNLAVALPVIVLLLGLDHGLTILAEQALDWPIQLAGRAVGSLLKTVFTFMGQLVLIACLVPLYGHLKALDAEESGEMPAQTS
jgi:hypothetical protein